jgi:hypothetical protein
MSILIIILICLAIYFLSAFLVYKHIQISHSKGGIFYGETPDQDDVRVVFLPVYNTFCAIIFWLIGAKEDIKKDHSKFFRLKD